MEEFNADALVQQEQVTPIQDLTSKIRQSNPSSNEGGFKFETPNITKGLFGGVGMQEQVQKPSFSREVPITEGYDLVGDEWMAKYPTYKQGRDNAEYAAQNQSTGEKWANGLQKFGAKTFNAVVGGTIGIGYGLTQGIADGSWNSIYDNNFSNWMSDLDTKLNYQLPNYYTKQEQQAGVFGQTLTANFWADKFLGGLSFTAGAIISEGIWGWATGGTSLATVGARLGGKIAGLGRVGRWGVDALGEVKTIESLAKMKGIYKSLNLTEDVLEAGVKSRALAVNFGRAGQVASIVGRTARSAGYEASVEALQYKKEAEEKFYNSFTDREPTVEEIANFEKENEATANAVFGANMAIVSTSNFVGLGNVLNIKNPVNLGITDFINKKAFAYGIDSATKQVVKGTMGQRLARNAFDYLIKPSATEGLFEEGLQGVTNKTANKWIEHTYNPKNTNETFTQMDAFYDSLAEQYGSEAGWKDNVLGMLIGVAGGTLNVSGAQKAKTAELEMKASADRTYDNKTLQSMIIPHRVQTANRIAGFTQESQLEENKGNLSKSQVAKVGATTSYINSKLVLGESISDMTKEMQGVLDSMTSEQWKELGIEPDQIQEEKDDRISEFKTLAQNWKTNKDYVQYMVGSKFVGEKALAGTALEETFGKFSKNAQVVEALTWQLTVGEQSLKIVEDIKAKVGSEIGAEHAKTMETIEQLQKQTKTQKRRISSLSAVAKKNRENRDKFAKEIIDLDKFEKTDTTLKRRLSLTQKLLEAENKLAQAEQGLEEIANQINSAQNYKSNLETVNLNQNIITGQDLLNVDENINKFKAVVEQQEQLDPQRASYLRDLMQEHSDAYSMYLQAKSTQKALTSKEFKIENIDGWVSNLFKKNKAMSENTQMWFEESIREYDAFKTALINSGLEKQPTAEEIKLEEELQSGEVSQETLQTIADKTELSKTEKIIYNENKEAVDELRKQNNLKTKRKSQEQINEEKIAELEQQRQAELSEVQPITVKDRVETTPITQTVKDTKAEQELLDKKQKVEEELTSLSGVITTSDVTKTEVTLPSKYNDKGNKFTLRDGKWQFQLTTGKWADASKKEVEEIQEALNENPNQARIDELNKELEDINSQLENIPTLEQEIEQEAIFTEREVPNQAEIDRINKKYDEKISALRPKAEDVAQEYRQRIDKMFNEIYDDLTPTEDLEAERPTKEEIEEYRNTTNKKTKRFQELKAKLQNWQLLDASSDDGYTSIVDLLDLITQLETQVEQEDTKDDVTEEEAKDIVNETTQDKGTGNADAKNIANNSTEPVTAKILDDGKISFSHLKAKYIVDQIGKDFTLFRNNKEIKKADINQIQPNDRVDIDNMSFTMDGNYRLVFDYEQIKSRQQQLNLYVEESQTYANFTSVYSIFGEERIKTPSQFEDANINRTALFNLKKGDVLTLHVKDTDGWNKTAKGGTLEEFKIYLKDSSGNIVSNLKRGSAVYEKDVDPDFANIRLRAFQNWEAQGRPDQMDLNISLKVGTMLHGAPELLYSDGKLIDGDISIEETQKVIIAKGYIENGNIKLDNEVKEVETVYLGKLTKNNPTLKIPIVVFRVGVNNIAFPITMKKSANPVEFDALLQGTPQEIVKKINQGIIDNRLKTEKLTFSDISLDYNGEVVLSEKAQKVREVFSSKTSFVSADTVADKKYNREDLARDASIRIDLSDLERVFSAPKVILDLTSAQIKQTKEVKYDNMTDVENALNDITLELVRDYNTNANTKYLDSKGDIIDDTHYTDVIDDNPLLKEENTLAKIHNINILREALSEELPKSLVNIIGAQKIKTIKNLLKQYDSIKAQTTVREEEVKNGLDNIDESCNK